MRLALVKALQIWIEVSFTLLRMLFWPMTGIMLFLSVFAAAISQTGKGRR
jgi:hypothetical protein